MLHFAHTNYLWLLVIIPISIVLYIIVYRNKQQLVTAIGNKKILDTLLPDVAYNKKHWKFALYTITLLCFILALAQPQLGTKQEKIKRKGIDVVICLDLSKSMLAKDVAPNRLQKAKLLIQETIKKLDGDRVGLVVFAGNAYIQMPLTIDYSSMLLYLRSVSTTTIPTQGTAVAAALEQATTLFDAKDTKHKAVILISDGEDHQEDAIDAAQALNNKGVKLFTVGAGTKNGTTIPIYDRKGSEIGVKKDAEGNTIVTQLNEDILQAIAKAGEGNYYILDNAKLVSSLLAKDIAKIETKTINDKMYTNYVEQYQYFLLIALLTFIINMFINYKK